MRRRFLVPAVLAVAALALTGCVDNTTDNSGSAGGAANNGSSVAKNDSLAALVPDGIKSRGTLKVGVDASYPPNEYKDASGQAIGWDVNLFNAVAGKLGLKVDYNIASFDTILPNITGGRYDVGVSSFTDTVEREKQVDFVNYYSAGILWASPADAPIVDPSAACGLRVAVESGTTEEQDEVPAKSKACADAGQPAIQILKFDGQDQATNAVVLGQADAMSADSPITEYAIAKSNGKLKAAGKTFEVAPYGYAVDKGSKMAVALKKATQSLVEDGTYAKILTKWGVNDGAISTITINAVTQG